MSAVEAWLRERLLRIRHALILRLAGREAWLINARQTDAGPRPMYADARLHCVDCSGFRECHRGEQR